MNRLTKRIDGHVFYTQGRYETTIPAEMETEDMRQCLKRLAAYEDTGLEPEEILAMLEQANIVCENVAPSMKHLVEMCKKIERERDAAVADLGLVHRCLVCAHSIHQTGSLCNDRPDKPADGSCDFKWRGVKDKKGLSSTSSKE